MKLVSFANKVLQSTNKLVGWKNLNPFNLPPFTLRLQYKEGITPELYGSGQYAKGTITQVSVSPNIWDWTYENPDWTAPHGISIVPGTPEHDEGGCDTHLSNLIAVLGGNTTGVTRMNQLLVCAWDLEYCALFDTSHVEDFHGFMENYDSAVKDVPLKEIPDFDFRSAKYVTFAFLNLVNVDTGILSTYNKLAALGNQIVTHVDTFYNCGSQTVQGAAELAQIPSSWGGTGA